MFAAAKSLQSCPTLCDPMDCSLPGFSVHGILQARTLEWVAISFSNIYVQTYIICIYSYHHLLLHPYLHISIIYIVYITGLQPQKLAPKRHLAASRNIIDCHNLRVGERGPLASRTAPHSKELSSSKYQQCYS